MRALLLLTVCVCACTRAPRTSVGPMSIAVPEGFTEDTTRATTLDGKNPLQSQSRVWVNKANKMQLGLSLARLPHQAHWEGLGAHDLLSEMVNQEITAGEQAGLKTVQQDRKFEGEHLHYRVEGDMGGKLATFSHTALWLDGAGDCWHASVVCTCNPADKKVCSELVIGASIDIASFDAGAR